MNDKLLREYIRSAVLQEKLEWGSFLDAFGDDKTKDSEAVNKIKRMWKKFTGFLNPNSAADDISDDWIEQQQLYYDADFSEEVQERIKAYTRAKLLRIMKRSKGDFDKSKRVMNRSLDVKFSPEIQAIKKAAAQREKEEDWDID